MSKHQIVILTIMALIVQKFGGTSVGSPERIRKVAARIIDTIKAGNQVVVIVSAMSGETNRLIDLAYQVSDNPAGRELDLLLASGEQVTISLLGLSLQESCQPSRSYLGSQVKIITDNVHTKARIHSVDTTLVEQDIKSGVVPVIAGFQGVTLEGHVTTLGRGGSDTSGVAMAAALHADLCEIYTDVDGVYTADPRLCANAIKLDKISHEEMLELSSLGSKVLQIRSVELAANYHVNLVVRSSFNENTGTLLCKEEPYMEKIVVSGVALDESEAKLAMRDLPDHPGICMQVFGVIADANINVDMIIQNTGTDGRADLSFTVPVGELKRSVEIIETLKSKLGFSCIEHDQNIAKVSIVGVGMRSHAGVAARAFQLLAENNINIDMISTSEIKISVVVKKADGQKAVKVLHDGFELFKKPDERKSWRK